MTTLVNDIKSLDFQPKKDNIGAVVEGIEDINQCISIILSTPKGSVPHNPEFGSDVYKYIDYPADEAVPNIINESIKAIQRWETRVDVVKITASVEKENVKISVQWKLKTGTTVTITEVDL